MRRRTFAVTFVAGIALFVIAGPVAAATSARKGGGHELAQAASHCDYRVYSPVFHYSYVTASVPFRCTTSHRNSSATVVMERRSNGKWHEVASETKQLDVHAGTGYTVLARWRPTVTCSGQQTVLTMRTHFTLKLNGSVLVDLTTPGEPVYVPCG